MTMQANNDNAATEANNNHKWLLLLTTCLLTVMLNFDATAVNLAVPVIAHQMDAKLATMQWVINAFVLMSAIFQIIGGRSGDLYGHRRIYVIGTIIFVLSSVFAGFATNDWWLILGRIGQGFALGIAYPMTIVLILNTFPQNQHGTAIGVLMGTMGVSLAIGPTLGGVIMHYLSWRWIFLVNLPIGIVTVICTYLFCKPDPVKTHSETLDYRGALFLLLGLGGVILALNQSEEWGVGSSAFLSTLIIGLIALFILFFVEKNRANRLIDFTLFKIRNYALNSLIRMIAQMVFLPVLFFIPIYLQNFLGYSPLYTGAIMLACTIVVGVLSPFAGTIVDKLGFKIPNVIAMVAFSIGCYLLSDLGTQINFPLLFWGLGLIGLGSGISFVSSTSGALSAVKPEQMGMATGVFYTIAWGACALGITIYGMIAAFISKASLIFHIQQQNLVETHAQLNALIRVARGLSPADHLKAYFSSINYPSAVDLSHIAYEHAFHAGFMFLCLISIVGILLSCLTKK